VSRVFGNAHEKQHCHKRNSFNSFLFKTNMIAFTTGKILIKKKATKLTQHSRFESNSPGLSRVNLEGKQAKSPPHQLQPSVIKTKL